MAALYHQNKSKPVPQWLRKTFKPSTSHRFTANIDLKCEVGGNSHTRKESCSDQSDVNDDSNAFMSTNKTNSHEMSQRYFDNDEGGEMGNGEKDAHGVTDHSAEWKQVAKGVENLLLLMSAMLTAIGLFLAISLFCYQYSVIT